MAYLIDNTYFVRELRIPGLQELRSEVSELLGQFIDERSRVLLQEALGNDLFNEFDAFVQADGTLNPSATQKWLNLVNGTDYTSAGETYTWQGLIYTQGAFPKSLLAYYTYCFYLEDHVSELSTMGVVQGKAKNSTALNPTQRYVKAWNNFVNLYQGDYYPYYDSYNRLPQVTIKRGIPFYDYRGVEERSGFVSLLTFLNNNDSDYPDAPLKLYHYENQIGV